MLRMDQVHVIRHKVLVEGQSVRSVARQLEVSRNTVRKYLRVPAPVRVEHQSRARPVFERVRSRIEALLEEWRPRTTAKQRVTGSRLHRQLVEEGFLVGVTTVRGYLREVRRRAAEVFVPLVHRPGEGQVDFFEVTVDVGGERRKVWKFVLRLMYSGCDFAWLYDSCDQLAFLDGHVRAFAWLGWVPQRLVYDNLSAAVKRRVGVKRELTERFLALVSHYLFEPCFARPGEGHDKGGVEARGKAIRLQHLTPIPQGESLAAVAGAVQAELDRVFAARVDAEGLWASERLAQESGQGLPLPAVAFAAHRVELVTVSRRSLVRAGGAQYSVPSSWAGLEATAYVGIETVRVVCGGKHVELPRARRPRPKLQALPFRKARSNAYTKERDSIAFSARPCIATADSNDAVSNDFQRSRSLAMNFFNDLLCEHIRINSWPRKAIGAVRAGSISKATTTLLLITRLS
jgi:transposase